MDPWSKSQPRSKKATRSTSSSETCFTNPKPSSSGWPNPPEGPSLSNLSAHDIENFTPLINSPEVGILGVGHVIQQPTVTKSGDIEVRSIDHFSLTFDHRAWDGAPAAEFLQAVVKNLSEPSWMAEG